MSNILNKRFDAQKTAFGELSVAELTPLIQISAQYGILDDVLAVNLGGTTTTQDSNFVVSTGTGANNVSAIISNREAQYKPGQGLAARFTALFTSGQPNSTQQAGFITSESAFAFGYDGGEFGILHARDGELEQQELTITSAATSNETATVTVDGVGYPVNITNTTINQNAFEIATELDAVVPGYNFTSVEDVIYCLSQLPDLGGGAFSFSSPTAIASWVEITTGTIPAETWVPKSQWNVNPDIDIDPTLGNVYQIQVQYLGYGGIVFSVEDPETARFEIVHIIKYANTSVTPSVSNPIFRLGWAARNTGNTSDIVVKGASAAAFIEGNLKYDGRPKSICHTVVNPGNDKVNIIAFRNRLTFNDKANRAEIIPLLVNMVSDANRTTFFEVVENPVTPDSLTFQRFEQDSLMEYSLDQAEITGGDTIVCLTASQKRPVEADLERLLEYIVPGVTYAITCERAGSNDIDASLAWKEDL